MGKWVDWGELSAALGGAVWDGGLLA